MHVLSSHVVKTTCRWCPACIWCCPGCSTGLHGGRSSTPSTWRDAQAAVAAELDDGNMKANHDHGMPSETIMCMMGTQMMPVYATCLTASSTTAAAAMHSPTRVLAQGSSPGLEQHHQHEGVAGGNPPTTAAAILSSMPSMSSLIGGPGLLHLQAWASGG
jgi:hypothetical protein